MPKKKTNYERRGFAKRLSSRIFSRKDKTSKQETQWRPRKTKFAALQPDDDDDFSAPNIINNYSFSVESETGGYKRDIDTKKKTAMRKLKKKTDFAGISIQPSSRDKHTNSTKKKKQRTDTHGFPLSSDVSMAHSFDSRQSEATRQTTMSDPTNLFSSQGATLTMNNLNHFSNEIENQNPRSKFHQFTIDEDKESTVILPVGFDDDDETAHRMFEESVSSSRYSGSKRTNSSYEKAFTPFKEEPKKAFDSNFTSAKENKHSGLPSAPSFRASDENTNAFSRSVNHSVASLCYSPSPKHESYGFVSPSKRGSHAKGSKNQQRFIRDGRTPLSPLNGVRESISGAKPGFQTRNDGFSGLASWSDFVQDTSSKNQSGSKPTDNISDIFEEKSSQIFEPRNGGRHLQWKKGQYDFSGENKEPVRSFDSADSDGTFRPGLEEEVPIGIQSFDGASRGPSAPSSIVSAASQGRVMYNGRVTASSFDDDDFSRSHHSTGRSSHAGSVAKPMGLPSNAIMASMLFQRHHTIDTRAVDEKLKTKREESSKLEANRGDVPRAIQAQDDTYSCVSSFSEDTSVGPWKKPTRDLLNHFTNSRTEYDAGRFRRDQLSKAPTFRLEIVKRLLAKGANLHAEDNYGKKPCHHTSDKDHLKVLQWLVVEHGFDVHAKCNDSDGCTRMHGACSVGHLDVIKWLVAEKDADIHVKDDKGQTPLHLAYYINHWEAVKWLVLVENGVDVHAADNYGCSPLHWAFRRDKISSLIENGAEVDARDKDKGRAPMLRASGKGHLENFAVEKGGDVAFGFLQRKLSGDSQGPSSEWCWRSSQNNHGETPLHQASERGYLEPFGDASNISGSPSRLACGCAHFGIFKVLVERGADVHAKDVQGSTSLHQVCEAGQLEMAKWLVVDSGADVHAIDDRGSTALHLACGCCRLEIVNRLVVENGADVHAKDNEGWTSLHVVCRTGHMERTVVNAKRNDDETQLHHACYKGRLEVAKWVVLEKGAGVNVKYNHGWTPLHEASNNGHVKVVRWLLENGSDVHCKTEHDRKPVQIAWEEGHMEKGVDVDTKNEKGRTLLHVACRPGDMETAKWLLEQGADVHAKDNDGSLPLHAVAVIWK
ncbi:MAG: hypothetical protein SGBAC_008624 [Bacillariaceae sp.]